MCDTIAPAPNLVRFGQPPRAEVTTCEQVPHLAEELPACDEVAPEFPALSKQGLKKADQREEADPLS